MEPLEMVNKYLNKAESPPFTGEDTLHATLACAYGTVVISEEIARLREELAAIREILSTFLTFNAAEAMVAAEGNYITKPSGPLNIEIKEETP